MLKNCFFPTQYKKLTNKTCGEIICQNETSFTIVCTICNMKIFEFNEFVVHFRDAHWAGICNKFDVKEETFCKQKDNKNESLIKIEGQEEQQILSEPDEDNDGSDHNEWTPEKEQYRSSLSNEDEEDSSDMEETIAILKKKLKSSKTKERPFKCNFCKHTFTNKSGYESHVKKHESYQFKCDTCSKSFAKETQLSQHHCKKKGYTCQICKMNFKTYECLRYHKESHIETKNFICDYKNCSKAFVTQRRLNAHRRLHFLEGKFVCEVCGLRLRNKEALNTHIRKHTGEKPFSCSLCERCFSTKSLLAEHKACHETERKHVCDVCGKGFNRPKALYHHKHLHLGIKKFVCRICGTAYAQAAGLSAHMRKHKEDNYITETQTNDVYNVIFPFMN